MVRRSLLIAVVGLVVGVSAPSAGADTTTFEGRFVCISQGVYLPLAGARVELFREEPGDDGLLGLAQSVADKLYGLVGQVEGNGPVRVASAIAGPEGEFSFVVPQTDPNFNYLVAVFLDDGARTTVSNYPDTSPAGFTTGTNQNDKAVQDYHTQVFPSDACPVWWGLEHAVARYRQLTRANPPYAVHAQYGTPFRLPYSDYTTIDWPAHYPPGPNGTVSAVVHEFWHTVRNFSLGSRDAFLRETYFIGTRSLGPCAHSDPRGAFNEGWSAFWAGDYYPAPGCFGVSLGDNTVEGMVAWALTEMAAGCANGPGQLLQVLQRNGGTIRTLDDFVHDLEGACRAESLDAAKVPRFGISPPVSRKLWVGGVRDGLAAARAQASRLGRLLPRAERLALKNCLRPPCTRVIAARALPSLIEGQLAQQRLLIGTLSAQLSRKALHQSSGPFTRALLNRLHTTPLNLSRGLARIGQLSLNRALAAVGPLSRRDHSPLTRRLLAALRSDRAAFALARRPGGRLPGAFALGALGAGRTHRVPTIGDVNFGGFPDGTLITAQTAAAGATFGSAQSLGFRNSPPAYVCPNGPTVEAGNAVAPACAGGPTGYTSTGTFARFTTPVTSVAVHVGSTQPVPGGFAAEVDAFDAAGRLVTQTAALVGSSTNGQGAGPSQTEQLTAPHGQSITYLALFFNSYFQPGPQLVFSDVAYTAP